MSGWAAAYEFPHVAEGMWHGGVFVPDPRGRLGDAVAKLVERFFDVPDPIACRVTELLGGW